MSCVKAGSPHVFIPRAFKVLLVCDLRVRAERRSRDLKKNPLEVLELIKQRDKNDRTRYEKFYPGSIWPEDDFDLVLDTAVHLPDECFSKLEAGHKDWLSKIKDSHRTIVLQGATGLLMNPRK